MERSIGFVGPVNYDLHYVIESFPKEGFLTSVQSSFVKMGGLCNIMGQLSKLDPSAPLVLLGPLGKDEKGQYLRRKMGESFPHLDLSHAVPIAENPYTVIFNSMETKERTFFNKAVSGKECGSADVDLDGSNCSFLLTEYMLDDSWLDEQDGQTGYNGATVLRDAQRKGMRTFLDLCSRHSPHGPEICRKTFPYVDVLVINEIETEVATGIRIQEAGSLPDEGKVRKAMETIRKMGVSTWIGIHTRTSGYLMDVKEECIWKQPALDLPKELVVEKTGAGDAFFAGILYSSWKGWSGDVALRLASAVAGSSLAGHDGYETVLPVKEEFAFFEKYAGGNEPVRMK